MSSRIHEGSWTNEQAETTHPVLVSFDEVTRIIWFLLGGTRGGHHHPISEDHTYRAPVKEKGYSRAEGNNFVLCSDDHCSIMAGHPE